MENAFIPWAFLEEYRGKAFKGEWPPLPEMYRIIVSRFGERACFTIYEPDRISLNYNEALKLIEAVSRWLYSKGIRRGDKVAVSGKNSPEWAVAYMGVLFAGATVVPIDYQIKTEEIDLLLKTSKAKILFIDEEKHNYYTGKHAEFGLTEIISLRKGVGTYVYDIDGPSAQIEEPGEFDLAAILFTSGTTGIPKGVMLTHQNLVSDCYLAQGTPFGVYYTDVFYALLPIHHAYTMLAVLIEAMSEGAEIVFGKKMVTKAILKDLKEAKITVFLGVPMLFNKLLAGILKGIRAKGPIVYGIICAMMTISGFIKKVFKKNPGKKMFHAILNQASLATLRVCICGGGPLAPSVFRKFNQLGIDFVQGYGLTETSPIINLNPIAHYKEASVGKKIPGIEMKILDPDERGIGEVIVKGPVVMKGYFEMPAETAASLTAEGFLKTGDLGYMDDEDYLYLTGRAKNMIVTEGGKNVYPEEIENEFQLFDEIDQIMVRGYIADKRMKKEEIEALVYPNPEALKDESGAVLPKAEIKARIEAIIAEVNQRLLPYQKITRTILLEDPMEMTTTKKIKRDSV
ncbi:AMP-dependent synthetase/ligase [Leadbettera azotonutricia]|uniref:AMP-dependent synthetase and ligase n=1 Tax=Leadbettera azotonutricia (strain ATCC BAA-888 / DSM 13862 / ZAS-9) TaxID=545695 RepID=F5Y981_LEAAZ|nr:AMP-binding protein [Leadbettera azotonutricia]AEF82669.1 AMP-dependent synthetase and ligase [Leadbettera azotonutricia ZAS-9]